MAEPIPFDKDFDATPYRVERVSPLVRRIVAPNPSAFTFTGTCTYIVGEGAVTVIDPGPADAGHLDALEAALAEKGERLTHILVTHTHRDHSPGATLLKQRTGAVTIASGPHGRPSGRDVPSGAPALDAAGDTEFDPDRRVAHGDMIEADGVTFECVFTPGHTANHMAFALPAEKALFSGDHVMAWSTSVVAPPDGNMTDYMDSLELLTGRDDAVYWPGHGGPVTDPRRFTRAFITHRRMREQAILKRIEAGDRTVSEIVDKVYAGLDQRLVPAAGLSVLAHLHDMAARGIIAAEGDAWRPA